MLFRWFLDLNIRGGSFDQWTFAKNRIRLLAHEVTGRFFGAVVSEDRRQRLLLEEHFSVDGTLLEAWASLKCVPAEGRGGGPACGGRRAEPVEELPGRAAFQRDPCIDDGPGGAVGAQGARAGGEAGLRGPAEDGRAGAGAARATLEARATVAPAPSAPA